jgi:hypothetical protein
MITNKYILIFLAGMIVFFSACQKTNIDTFLPDGPGVNADTNWVNNIDSSTPAAALKADISIPNFKDSININTDDVNLVFSSGLQCLLKANTLTDSNGLTVKGTIAMQSILVQKKGDMIRLNKPATSNNYILSSAGMFFIKLTKDGSSLKLAPQSKLQVKYREDQHVSPIKLFNGITAPQGMINWYADDEPGNKITSYGEGYEVKTNYLGWVNAASVIDSNISQDLRININLAKHFTNANTVAWLVFKGYRSAINFTAEAINKKFICSGIPYNKEATVVVISKQVNDYYLGSQDITTPAMGSTALSVPVTPVKTSLDALLKYLNSL